MLLKIYPNNPNQKDLDRVASTLRDGGLVIYPTDTLYAIGCDALNVRAVERICRIKGVDPQKSKLSIVCHDLSEAGAYTRIDNNAFKLLKRHLPGAFTFILPAGADLPRIYKSRREVGLRIPDNPIALELVRTLGNPLLTMSVHDPASDVSTSSSMAASAAPKAPPWSIAPLPPSPSCAKVGASSTSELLFICLFLGSLQTDLQKTAYLCRGSIRKGHMNRVGIKRTKQREQNSMKKFLMSAIVFALCSIGAANAQLEKGSVLVGGGIGDIQFGLGSGSNFSINLTPRVGYFVQNNLAFGAKVNAGFTGQRGDNTTFSYGINGFGRYYLGNKEVEIGPKEGHFFGEIGVGLGGVKGAEVGFNVNFGPGYAYFLNEHVALEALALYNGQFGKGTVNGLSLNVGLQIYLPVSKLEARAKSLKK